jgi:hypothetical protein
VEEKKKKKRVQSGLKNSQRDLCPGYRNCPVRRPDLSSESRFSDLKLSLERLERLAIYITWLIDHNLAQIDHVDRILKKIYTQGILENI